MHETCVCGCTYMHVFVLPDESIALCLLLYQQSILCW